ncbi:dihydrolipoamide acetyltransferase family protein [Nocardia sp. NPDC058176]|uniref:dihydrolipoamide acetyltransferase family protein n=1 Tax=Nocardia sp. NPDC058176 TaxID=3346368 RepID=UPI0036DEE70A
MPDIIMPRLSDTMEDGVVSSWLKQVGDRITRGEIVAEIETDKALMELEAYDDGVLERILAEPGARIPIGEPIAVIGDGLGGSVSAGGAAESSSAARQKTSPLARKVARELGVDLVTVEGTGPGGRITKQDVEAAHGAIAVPTVPIAASAGQPMPSVAVAQASPAAADYEEVPLTSVQQVSAARLVESKQQAPHIYLTSAIDVTDLLVFRARVNQTQGDTADSKISVNDLLVKAVAGALRDDRSVNVSFAGDKLLRHNGINLGIAVATPVGLLVPVIRDADRKSVSEIAAEIRDKATRARARKLRADEMTGGTFTLSNLGMFGVEQFTAVINPPESAILAVGAATEELRLDGDEVVARTILRVTLSADHRAIDGAVAAQFLANLKERIESPLRIVV